MSPERAIRPEGNRDWLPSQLPQWFYESFDFERGKLDLDKLRDQLSRYGENKEVRLMADYVDLLDDVAKQSVEVGSEGINGRKVRELDNEIEARLRRSSILTGSKNLISMLDEVVYPFFGELENLMSKHYDDHLWSLRNEVKGASISLLAEIALRGTYYGKRVDRVAVYDAGKILFGFLYAAMRSRGVYEGLVERRDVLADSLFNLDILDGIYEKVLGDRAEVRVLNVGENEVGVVIVEAPVKSFSHFVSKLLLNKILSPEMINDIHRRSMVMVGRVEGGVYKSFSDEGDYSLEDRRKLFRSMVLEMLMRVRKNGLRFVERSPKKTTVADNVTINRWKSGNGNTGTSEKSKSRRFAWIKGILVEVGEQVESGEISEVTFWMSLGDMDPWLGFETKKQDDQDYLLRKWMRLSEWAYPNELR